MSGQSLLSSAESTDGRLTRILAAGAVFPKNPSLAKQIPQISFLK